MPVGRGFTAARQQASRLAGLVRLPDSCIVKAAIRRQASWLAIKASVILIHAGLLRCKNTKITPKHPTLQGVSLPSADREKENPSVYPRRKIFQLQLKLFNPQGVSMPHATCGGAERR